MQRQLIVWGRLFNILHSSAAPMRALGLDYVNKLWQCTPSATFFEVHSAVPYEVWINDHMTERMSDMWGTTRNCYTLYFSV